jgi:hypothetical protein
MEYLFYVSKGSLICHKILQLRANSFNPPLKEGVLRIFIALKIRWPQPDLNFQTLCPVASVQTTDDDMIYVSSQILLFVFCYDSDNSVQDINALKHLALVLRR